MAMRSVLQSPGVFASWSIVACCPVIITRFGMQVVHVTDWGCARRFPHTPVPPVEPLFSFCSTDLPPAEKISASIVLLSYTLPH